MVLVAVVAAMLLMFVLVLIPAGLHRALPFTLPYRDGDGIELVVFPLAALAGASAASAARRPGGSRVTDNPGSAATNRASGSLIASGAFLRPSVEPEDRVPAAIAGEVAGEHEQSVGGLL